MLRTTVLLVALVGVSAPAWAEGGADCIEGKAPDLQIRDCTELIQSPGSSQTSRAWAFLLRGGAYFNKGEFDRAAPDLEEAVRLNPTSGQAHYARGILRIQKGSLDLAIADLNQAILTEPKNPLAYDGRGTAYTRKRD
jgi:tetratricopeptide (TPR) repeat protein